MMNKHWDKATKEQKAWGDEHGFWAVETEVLDGCDGCDLWLTDCVSGEPCMGSSTQPSIIYKQKEVE